MPFNKVHKRRSNVAGNVRRQATGTSTATARATSTTPTSAVHNMQPPTGPPLFISSTTSGAGATGSNTSSGTNTSSATSNTQTSATQTDTVVATSNTGGVAATQPTSAASVTRATGSRTVTTRTTASASASPSATGTDSDGPSLGTIAGAAAAAVIGIGIIAAIVVWFMRRRKRNSDPDEEPFNRNSFLRQSTVIPDDGPVPSRTRASPPPSMVERQPIQPMYGAPQPFDNQNAFGYNTQPSYSAGQFYAPNAANPFGPGGAPATPLPASPGYGYEQPQPGFNNGGYSDLTRGSVVQDYPPSPHAPMSPPLDNPHSPNYPGPETFPVPHDNQANGPAGMYAQPGFPELTPATASAQQGHVVAVSNSVHDGRETPVQLGFAPVQTPNANQQAAQPGDKTKKRETVYNDEDAYGGI